MRGQADCTASTKADSIACTRPGRSNRRFEERRNPPSERREPARGRLGVASVKLIANFPAHSFVLPQGAPPARDSWRARRGETGSRVLAEFMLVGRGGLVNLEGMQERVLGRSPPWGWRGQVGRGGPFGADFLLQASRTHKQGDLSGTHLSRLSDLSLRFVIRFHMFAPPASRDNSFLKSRHYSSATSSPKCRTAEP